MLIKFLGTSSVKAIPRPGCDCSQCRSKDPRDRRTRSAILIYPEQGRGVDGKILIDCGPDILKQLKTYNLRLITYVIITHRHPDHLGGLRKLKTTLRLRSGQENKKLKIIYLDQKQDFQIEGLRFRAFPVPHSKIIKTYGLVFGQLVYAPDFSKITPEMIRYIKKAKIAVLDGSMFSRDFGGHLAMTKTIRAIPEHFKSVGSVSKPLVYFTHNGHTRIPHQELEKYLQKIGGRNIHLAYDGLEIAIDKKQGSFASLFV